MTLLDEYRRTVYSSSNEERKRRLQSLTSQGSRPPSTTKVADSGVASAANALATNAGLPRGTNGKKRLKASSNVRLQELPDLKSRQPQEENEQPQQQRILSKGSVKKAVPVCQPVADVFPSNQQDTERSNQRNRTAGGVLEKRRSLLEKISLLSSFTNRGTSNSTQTPKELPSQFIHRANISISKWTVIVSNTTLFRIAARNKRIAKSKQRLLLLKSDASGQGDEKEEEFLTAETTRAIIMNGAETITDLGLQAIADNVPTLEALEIANAFQITDAGLRTLALSCSNLTRLNISSCRNIKGPGLGAIGDHSHRLTELGLADCAHLGEWVIMRCVYGFTLLEHLNVARCSQITDHLLKTLAHQCRQLRSIILSDCTQVSDVGVVHIAQKCHKLEKIALSRAQSTEKITDTSCAALGEHCPNLKDVNLAGCNFLTDAAIKWIADGCHTLENLDISNVFYLTDVSMRALGDRCHNLRTLRLPNAKNVSDVGLRLLSSGCPNLEVLHVNNLYLVSDGSNRDFGLEGLRAIANDCKKLKDLNLSGCFQLVERALVALGVGCRELQRVNLKACPKVTLLAVNALLHGCQNLVSLNLSGVLLCNNAMLAAIGAHCPNLRELFVAQCDKISDNGLRHLAPRADQFEILDFSGCLLISDTGLNLLVDGFQNPRIAHLYLVGCALITQDSIARLAFACPLLLTLSVHGCRVSARVLRSLCSSWQFGELRVPSGAAVSSTSAEMGIFPMHRAKDRRFVEETCAKWLAAVKIQNLYRFRKARELTLIRKEEATRLYVARRLQSIWRGRKARREAMIKKVIRRGLEKFAIKIQRRYRAKRLGRKTQQQFMVIMEKQLEKYARMVQRRYRAKRSAKVARLIFSAKKRQHEREVRAATQMQRRFRGVADRKRFNLIKIQKQIRERDEQEATLRIQTIYRGRADRKKAKELQRQKEREIEIMHQRTTQLQAQFRRRKAVRVAAARRQAIRDRELAATKLQLAYRTKKARQTMDVLKIASYHRECQLAARIIQKRWRTRKDRIGLAIIVEVRRQRLERQEKAVIYVQRTFRRYLIRKRARAAMLELLKLKQNDLDMEAWAATLVQSHWRRIQARKELERIQAEKHTRWKQLIDTYNQHGMGYGAPFYYVRAELLTKSTRKFDGECRASCLLSPTGRIVTNAVSGGRTDVARKTEICAETLILNLFVSQSNSMARVSTSLAVFLDPHNLAHGSHNLVDWTLTPSNQQCNDVVHGRGKRQLHEKRKLFNFYGIRCDYGDGEFPSKWPSEIDQDRERGYNFISMTPKENYQDMLWQIAQYVSVATGKWDPIHHTPNESTTDNSCSGSEVTPAGIEISTATATLLENPISGALFSESDFDEFGNSLWERFYDYSKEEYRQYHRLSKRVKSVQSTADSDFSGAVDTESTQGGEMPLWNPEYSIDQGSTL